MILLVGGYCVLFVGMMLLCCVCFSLLMICVWDLFCGCVWVNVVWVVMLSDSVVVMNSVVSFVVFIECFF